MALVALSRVGVDLPVYDFRRANFKRLLLSLGTGGRFGQDDHKVVHVHALSEITLTFRDGDRIGLVGRNGAGKSTLLRVIAGVYQPSRGVLRREGRVVSLLDLAFGMNLDISGQENIMLRGLHLGFDSRTLKKRADEIAEFAQLGPFLHMPLRTYSSGMYFRLVFAISTSLEPEILLMDEWISSGDAEFLEKVEDRLRHFMSRSSITVLASHDLDLIRRTCTKGVFLDSGQLAHFGPVDEVLESYALSWAGE
jgi:lipopolysaccharide transport system ATP-binding protein